MAQITMFHLKSINFSTLLFSALLFLCSISLLIFGFRLKIINKQMLENY